MATIFSSAIILQPLSIVGGSGYPTSGNGYTEVTVNYNDTVIIPIRSGSTGTSAGTSNYGESAVGNSYTGGTFTNPLAFSSSFPTRYITVSNIQYDGNISIWCKPSNSGSNVGWRGRVKVNVNLVTSISLNSSSITMSSSDTSYQNGLTQGGAGTLYYALTVANYPNGSHINSLFTGGDSRFVARTFNIEASKPFAMANASGQQFITNYLPTSSSPSKTVYIYAANFNGQKSQYLGISYTVALQVPRAPNVTANVGIIQNGFGLTTTSSGTTSGTITYEWSASAHVTHSTGYVASSSLGVGVEWQGSTWTVRAKASIPGEPDAYSTPSSVTLPNYSINSGPGTIEEGDTGTFGFNINNNFVHTLYWQATPTADFITSNSSVGSTSGGTGISITPTSGDGTEGSESATLSLYINNTFNALNLVASRNFTITENATTITTPGPPSVTHNNADLRAVTVTVTSGSTPGANGTLQFAQTTSNSITGATWESEGTPFSHPRNTTRYYWARRSASNVSSSTVLTVPFLTDFDSSVTISPSTRQVTSTGSATDGQSATFTITNPSGSNTLFANSVYRLITSNINPAWRKSKVGESGGAADITLLENDGDLPPDGTAATYTYQLSGKRANTRGGPSDNIESNWTNISGQTVTVQRTVTGGSPTLSPATMNEGATQELTTANGKISGLSNNFTYYWRLFDYSDFVTTAGQFTTSSSGTVPSGSGISIQTAADNTTEGDETSTVKLYSSAPNRNGDTNPITSANFTITDTSTGATGGSTGGPSATGTYGLVVKSSSGNNVISPSQRSAGLILAGTTGAAIAANGGTRTGLSAPEVTATNGAEVIILISPNLGTGYIGGSIGVTRQTNQFTITNNTSRDLPANTPYYIVRC